MNQDIELKQALMQLPLETPLQSQWHHIQSRLAEKPAWPKWAFASAASAALALIFFMPNPMSQQTSSTIARQQTTQPLEHLIKQSNVLETSFYAQQDDAISSATVIAANLAIEDQLSAIDQQLSQLASRADALSLWQSRINLLNEGVRLNKTNADFNAQGRNYDLALASVN